MKGRPGSLLALAGLSALVFTLLVTPLGTGASSSRQALKAPTAKPLRGPRPA
jgi:hypothetical protein